MALTAEALPAELRRTIVQLARTPRLLVACDYDGTLAPIVADPNAAKPLPESVHALRSLASLPATTTAVISGRALRDLATLSRLPSEVHLVGSHGSEFDVGFVHELEPQATELRTRLQRGLQEIVAGQQGVTLEAKPASVAVHVRRAEDDVAERVLDQVRSGPATWDGVQVTEGKAVIELAVVQTDKGNALDALRHQVAATAAIFLGDDVTDEKAFARLHGPDLGLKVGEGDTLAEFRVADTTQVATALAFLMEERRTWLYGEQAPPIERLTMLSNERTVALLTPDARLTWMCHPGPDSAAVFADLLGGPGAGHFSVRPHGGNGAPRSPLPLGQRYVPGTMTVETRWSRLLVTDYLEHGVDAHRTDLIRVITGETTASIEFAPRPEFGQVPVRLVPEAGGLRVMGTSEPMVLHSPGVQWEITSDGMHESARAVVAASEETPIVLELRCGTEDLAPSERTERQRRAAADVYWSEWLETLTLPAVETDLVGRSALTLRGLCNTDTGGIMAAATTSLPEEIGGVRNWDYRYCWLRDGSMTAQALVTLGSTAEAEGFLDWLHRVLETLPGPERLHPLYSLQGTSLGPEAVIDSLPGYAGSRPVRVGNLADQQVQLDVFGPVVELVWHLAEVTGEVRDRDWQLVKAMAEAVSHRWFEPDHGIWEERDQPRHHVYSKVMCWVTLDRALKIAERYGREVEPTWGPLRDQISQDVIKNGWQPDVQAFTTAYEGSDLDAASLHVGLSGLIDPSDERFRATVNAIESELRSGSTVYRYRRDDGLPGDEGGFHLCAAWLIEAYLLIGRRTEAEELFQQIVDTAGPTGLLAEEYDPIAERSLGNHPQAYSHLGLIRCAQLLSR
ncbi:MULTISPECIES: trehalose-phosphatase [unclassified Saccharopolyspora]|uniref:trehalose-phosphatase n=1 Tax=unclassified Saccharopolyspora TaxID=2646250 RepID=UPI001CD3AD34|nr:MULTISPECIES: trehalose-phosphatase [unclassified Saccharopolyspora]MCA1189424.1 trehalose-phosphatase [Saccharopolyspora sp. 6T]MCA1194747.1 trehalose-phosphatase [Saccharopolyspora sp. 6V]MCA1228730.1 trehalose-phosphatase [Saccharopolyspora sp. 6M]MCA1282430.1 trehalose-phosphatase [Saccharopolyspora sp. 7B]